MCIFQKYTFQLVSETPKPPCDYYRDGETEKEHRERMRVLQKEQTEQNRSINKNKRLFISSGKKEASESTSQYIARSGTFH